LKTQSDKEIRTMTFINISSRPRHFERTFNQEQRPAQLLSGVRRQKRLDRERETSNEKPADKQPQKSTSPQRALSDTAIPPHFQQWLGSAQGLRFKEKMGANYDEFVRQYSLKLKPAQQEIFIVYMRGELVLNASIAEDINRRMSLVANHTKLLDEQVRATIAQKNTALNMMLNRSSGGRFENIKALRDFVGYGASAPFTLFLTTSKAKVVAQQLGTAEFNLFTENVAQHLNPIEQMVLVEYLKGGRSSLQIARTVNQHFKIVYPKLLKTEDAINSMLQQRDSAMNMGLFKGANTVTHLLDKKTIKPANGFGESVEFKLFLRSKRGQALKAILGGQREFEKFKTLITTHFPHRRQAVLSIYLGSGLSDGEVAGLVNAAYPPKEGEKRLSNKSMGSLLRVTTGANAELLAMLPSGLTIAALRKELKKSSPADVQLTTKKPAVKISTSKNTEQFEGIQTDFAHWLLTNSETIQISGFQRNFESPNVKRIKSLSEQTQYALFVYLSSNLSITDVIAKVKEKYGSIATTLTLENLHDYALKLPMQVHSNEAKVTWMTAINIRAEKNLTNTTTTFETTTKGNANHPTKLQLTLGTGYANLLEFVRKNFTPSKQYLLALVLNGELSVQECVNRTNRHYALIGIEGEITLAYITSMMVPTSRISQALKVYTNGRFDSIRTLRQAMQSKT
jgi:hypothetical protein